MSLATDPVTDQQVYTASWILSYPGNSGGPFYVQFNGYYYPAGVYLGTLFNGMVPYASAVRAIDSNVVNLITNAAALGDSGTNNSGGGVITIIPTGVSSSHPAYLIMNLAPPAAVAAGAAWEFTNQPSNDYLSAGQSVQELSSSTEVGLQFLPIAGWNLPANQTLTLVAGDNSYTASYTVAVAWATPAAITYGTRSRPRPTQCHHGGPAGQLRLQSFRRHGLERGHLPAFRHLHSGRHGELRQRQRHYERQSGGDRPRR